MALGLKHTWLAVLGGFVLLAAPACVVEEKDKKDDDDEECVVDFDCASGEVCLDDECVAETGPGSGGASAGSAGKGSSGSTGTSGSSGSAGSSGGSAPGSGGSGGSTSGGSASAGAGPAGGSNAGGSGPSAGTGGSGGSSPAAGTGGSSTAQCSEDDPIACPTAESMTLCIDGVNQTFTCVEACEEILGFETGPCEAGQGCVCGAPLDEECATGTIGLCSCVEPQCTEDEALDLYISCFSNEEPEYTEALRCLADYVDVEAQTVDCEGGESCLPEITEQ